MRFIFLLSIVSGAASLSVAGEPAPEAKASAQKEPVKKVIYPENQTIDFEGLSLEGELKTPGEFYFQNRNQERFDSLTKRRVNFRREMLRDSIQSN
jgi:hypothetical protein